MKTMTQFAFLLAFAACLALPVSAQIATPNTTLCAAQSQTATTACLTSTTGVANQTGVYIDQEYELVQLTANIPVCTGPCYVPVSRGNRAAGSGPTGHVNSSIAWLALTPGQSVTPGLNGFSVSSTMPEIGPCTRSSQTYLPQIFPNRGIKRDCAVVTNNANTGQWVDFAPGAGYDYPSPTPIQTIAVNGALSVTSGNYVFLTKAGVIAATLAAPTAGIDDGMIITISADNGAFADTLTATGLLQTGGAGSPYTTATFGVTTAFNGASLTLKAYGGFWFVIASQGVTFS